MRNMISSSLFLLTASLSSLAFADSCSGLQNLNFPVSAKAASQYYTLLSLSVTNPGSGVGGLVGQYCSADPSAIYTSNDFNNLANGAAQLMSSATLSESASYAASISKTAGQAEMAGQFFNSSTLLGGSHTPAEASAPPTPTPDSTTASSNNNEQTASPPKTHGIFKWLNQ